MALNENISGFGTLDYTETYKWLVSKGYLNENGGISIQQLINLFNNAEFLEQFFGDTLFIDTLINETNFIDLLVNNETFYTTLVNNEEFTTLLANNNNFVTNLANNETFVTTLANNNTFLTALSNNATFQTIINNLSSGGAANIALKGEVVGNPGQNRVAKLFSRFLKQYPAPSGINDDFNESKGVNEMGAWAQAGAYNAWKKESENWEFWAYDNPAIAGAITIIQTVNSKGQGCLRITVQNTSAQYVRAFNMYSKKRFNFQNGLLNFWFNGLRNANLDYFMCGLFPNTVNGIVGANGYDAHASAAQYNFNFRTRYDYEQNGSDGFQSHVRTHPLAGNTTGHDITLNNANEKGSDLHIISFSTFGGQFVINTGGEHYGEATIFNQALTDQTIPDCRMFVEIAVKPLQTVTFEIEYISSNMEDVPLLTGGEVIYFNHVTRQFELGKIRDVYNNYPV